MKIGYLGKEHSAEKALTIQDMKGMLEKENFKIVYANYYMPCPLFKIPFEERIESFINHIGLGKLMCGQIIVGQKIKNEK